MNFSLARVCALVGFALLASVSMTVGAQTATGIPGPNINIIGPTPEAAMVPDNTLKQKNEPLCAVRPDEPRQFFCVYNDYRGVDKPTIGDSWIGASMSRDEGLTWLSRLVPGFPNSPGSLNLGFAADPGIAAVPGLALVNFIAANRDGNLPGGLFLQRWVELNKEDGFPWAFADTRQISAGTAGQFRDKPAMLVTLAPKTNPPAAPLSLQLTVGGQPVTQKVAAGELHIAYANFTGNDPKETSQIKYLKSSNYGNTWSNEVKLSESVALNQGVSLAANGNTLVAVWRQFDFNSNQPHSLVYAVSTNRGNTWSKAATLGPNFICPFDQAVSETQFRTTAMPVIVSDGSKFFVFWAQRQVSCATGQSRIVYVSSTNGSSWDEQPTVLDDSIGHQYMPAAFAAGGVVEVVWYDTRDDEYYPPGQSPEPFIADTVDPSGVAFNKRHTADVYHLQIKGGIRQSESAVKVSQYAKGTWCLDANGSECLLDQQLERNFVNARMFRQGTAPFNGDYISAAAPAFRLDRDGVWISNNGPVAAGDVAPAEPTFQAAWADNRHVRSNVYLNPGLVTGYTEPQFTPLQGEPGSNPNAPKCVPDVTDPMSALARNQRVLSSVIKPGVLLTAATPSKSGTIQRAHVVVLQNLRDDQGPVQDQDVADFQLQLTGLSAPLSGGDIASFAQFGDALTSLDVSVPEGSSVARTVFVTPGPNRPAPSVLVKVSQCVSHTTVGACVPAATPIGSIVLNGNPTAGTLKDPDCWAPGSSCFNSPSVQIFEAHDPALAPDAYSVANPSYRNPSLRNPSLRNQTYENPSLENQTVEYPSLRNPSLRNTPLDDSGADAEAAYTDFVYTVTNTGNTTTGYNLKPLLTGDDTPDLATQLIVTKVYPQPTAQNCLFTTLDEQQVVVNIVKPDLAQATPDDPLADPGINAGPEHATFLVEPGGTRQVTLRVWGVNIATNPNFARRLAVKVYSQAKNTDQTSPSCEDQTSPSCETPNDVEGNPDTDRPVFSSAGSLQGPFEADSPGGWTVQYTEPTAIDCATPGCTPVALPPSQVNCTPPSGEGVVLGLGSQAVFCTATDLGGNTTTAEFRFEVRDTVPPVVTVPANVVPEATGPSGAIVNYAGATFSDTVGVVSSSCTPASGSTFALGTTTVTCSATDGGGNSASKTFTVTVRDTTTPTLSVPENIVTTTSGTTATVNYQVTATDNVGVTALACTSTSPGVTSGDLTKGGSFPKGTSTVACTATDAAGNVTAKSFTVTVNSAPYGGLDGVYANGSKSINSSVPLDFGFTGSNGSRVDSSLAQPLVKVYSSGKTCVAGTLGTLIASYPGSSNYRYSASSLNWQFNWKTTGLTAGCYNITVTSVQTGQTFISRNSVTLTK